MKKYLSIRYTLSEKRGIAILIALIILINLATIIGRSLSQDDIPVSFSEASFKDRADPVSDSESKIQSKVDINKADSTELLKLYGIGPSFSRRIIKYRNLLGGYHHKAQLLEVYGMDSVRWLGFIESVRIDTAAVKKINIRIVEFKELLKHPYVSYDMVKLYFQYRDQHGPPNSIKQAWMGSGWPDSLRWKLEPYLVIGE